MKCFKCGRQAGLDETIECGEPGRICILKEWQKSVNRNERWKNFLVAGVTGSGKTYYIFSLIEALISPTSNIRMALEGLDLRVTHYKNNPASRQVYQKLKQDHSDAYIEGTQRAARYDPLVISIENRSRKSPHKRATTHIALFNLTGEFFHSEESMVKYQQILNADGIILLLDPLQTDALSKYITNPLDIAPNNNNEIIENIKKVISDAQGSTRRKLTNPVAFCVSKFDLLQALSPYKIENPYLMLNDLLNAYGDFQNGAIRHKTDDILDLLRREGYHDLHYLDESFSAFELFAVAPIGHDEIMQQKPLAPKGILAPFFWLLAEYNIIDSRRLV